MLSPTPFSLLTPACWGDGVLDRRPRVVSLVSFQSRSTTWYCLSWVLCTTVSPTAGRTAEVRELEKLPVLPFGVSEHTLDLLVLDDVGRGGVFGIESSDESESTSFAGGQVGLELRGGEGGFPRFWRLLSTFSAPPERQWTFFGDGGEGPLTTGRRQGCSTSEAMVTRPDVDLQRSRLALCNYMALEKILRM